jgi:hypothetical protein
MPEDCRRLLPDHSLLVKGVRERENIASATPKDSSAGFIPVGSD